MANVKLLPGSRNLPNQLTLSDQPTYTGGEGSVYFTTDDHYAVKIYHKYSKEKQKFLKYILGLGKNLREDEERFLAWPLGIVNKFNDTSRVGVVTRRVPSSFIPLYKLIYSPVTAKKLFQQGRSWLEYLKMARGTAATIRTIHGKGMAHADIHLKNFLSNPISGEVVLIDLDGLVVKGYLPPQVKGMLGFIAPEVMEGRSQPNNLTDRHSLAVLVLWILLLRNVMQPQRCYDPDDIKHDDELGYGKYACYSENPNDRCNWVSGIGTPLFRNGVLSYRSLTPKLQNLTNQALIAGLHDPQKRPQAIEWERSLAEAYDVLISCPSCRQSFFYPYWLQPPPRRQCPFCGAGVRSPFPSVLELLEARSRGSYTPVRRVVVYHRLPVFADLIEPGQLPPFSRRGVPIIGHTVWDPKGKVHRLVNVSDDTWQIIRGGKGRIGRKESVALQKGITFSFGSGKRLVRVVE